MSFDLFLEPASAVHLRDSSCGLTFSAPGSCHLLKTCFRNGLIQYVPPPLFQTFPRAVRSLLSMPWPTTYSVSQQLVACMEVDTSPSQTTLPTQRLWPLCRRMQRWRLQHMGDTQAMLFHRPFPPQPSSCPSTTSTRHINVRMGPRDWTTTTVCPITWTREHPNARKECRLKQILRKQTVKQWNLTSHISLSVSWTQGNHMTGLIMQHHCKLEHT